MVENNAFVTVLRRQVEGDGTSQPFGRARDKNWPLPGPHALPLERKDAERRGKGYALEAAFALILAEDFAEAVMVR